MIEVTPSIQLDENELQFDYVRASGPGGQNVNKVSTSVQLHFDAAGSPSLPADVKERLIRLAGRRATVEGVIVIDAREHRTQEGNRAAAIERLVSLVRQASEKPRPRKQTRPTNASRQKRLESKRRRSAIKNLRRTTPTAE